METGKQLPADEVRELRLPRAAWKQQLRTGHAALQHDSYEAECKATRITNVELFLVPGLVQAAEYARAVFT